MCAAVLSLYDFVFFLGLVHLIFVKGYLFLNVGGACVSVEPSAVGRIGTYGKVPTFFPSRYSNCLWFLIYLNFFAAAQSLSFGLIGTKHK